MIALHQTHWATSLWHCDRHTLTREDFDKHRNWGKTAKVHGRPGPVEDDGLHGAVVSPSKSEIHCHSFMHGQLDAKAAIITRGAAIVPAMAPVVLASVAEP